MKKVWVLGSGQLGAMLKHAGMPLAIDVRPIGLHDADDFTLAPEDVVTAEQELWPDTPATAKLAVHERFVNKDVFSIIADRKTQKSHIDGLDIATAPWHSVESGTTTASLHDSLGERVLLKRRTGGYDGKGQHWLKQAESTEIPADWYGEAIAEKAINFDKEVSLVGARNAQGECFFYPLALNLHVNGVLNASVAGLKRLEHLQAQAEEMLGKILQSFDYVGVMAMECFREGDTLMVNELAPRVHNSGHWTQAGATISQFEAHLRTIADLPMITPQLKGLSVMINLLGTPYDNRWLSVQGAELYWYNKGVRPGRKLGHINFCQSDVELMAAQLDQLSAYLPEHYDEVIEWSKQNLA